METRRWIGPGLGVVILLVFLLLPPLEPLTPFGMKVTGVFLFTAIWWISVGVGYPSIMCMILMALTGIMTAKEAFAGSWGSWMVSFIIGIYGLIVCLEATGFSRRFALFFMSRPFTVGHPWRLIAMFLLSALLLGGFMSSAAVVAVWMAIAAPMLEMSGYKKGDHFPATLMLGLLWVATSCMIMNAFSHVRNITLMEWLLRDTGYNLTIPVWLVVGYPMGLVIFLLILGFLRFVLRPDVSKFGGEATVKYVREELAKMGPMKLEEKIAAGVFLAVIMCWVLPGITGNALPEVTSYLDSLTLAMPPLVGACLLCIIRVKNQPLLTLPRWMGGVPWGTSALVLAITLLTVIIGDPETGIPQLFTNIFEPIAKAVPFFVFLLISVGWALVQTQFMSNFVTMTLVYAVMMPLALATGAGDPTAWAWAVNAAACLAITLPSGTTVSALIIGTDWVSLPFAVRYGTLMTFFLLLVITLVVYPYASFVFRLFS